jgi:hypothetical protein
MPYFHKKISNPLRVLSHFKLFSTAVLLLEKEIRNLKQIIIEDVFHTFLLKWTAILTPGPDPDLYFKYGSATLK